MKIEKTHEGPVAWKSHKAWEEGNTQGTEPYLEKFASLREYYDNDDNAAKSDNAVRRPAREVKSSWIQFTVNRLVFESRNINRLHQYASTFINFNEIPKIPNLGYVGYCSDMN